MDPKTLTILLAIATIASLLYFNPQVQTETEIKLSQFELWKHKHQISFQSALENAYRERIFQMNKLKIDSHNSKIDKTYKKGLNKFSAMTDEQFKQKYLSLIIENQSSITVLNQKSEQLYFVQDIDWTTKGAVTDIKDQGNCGSCWAFSTTGALEGLSKVAYGNLKSFSEQQLVDCSYSYGNQGCNGGLMDNAFKYVKDRGIVLQSQYPYKAIGGKCIKNSGSFKISGFVDIKSCSELANALSARPISVAVDASNWSTYASGVFNDCESFLNHGVLMVGANDNQWKIKNSWGTQWGEKGFMRLKKGNTCGICNAASYPLK